MCALVSRHGRCSVSRDSCVPSELAWAVPSCSECRVSSSNIVSFSTSRATMPEMSATALAALLLLFEARWPSPKGMTLTALLLPCSSVPTWNRTCRSSVRDGGTRAAEARTTRLLVLEQLSDSITHDIALVYEMAHAIGIVGNKPDAFSHVEPQASTGVGEVHRVGNALTGGAFAAL